MAVLSLIACMVSLLHVGQLAEYTYSLVNDKVELEITLEYSEMRSLHLNDSCDANKMTALCVSNYIVENSKLNVNAKAVSFELVNSYVVNDHLVIVLNSVETFESINSIKISQTTFYEFFENYRNRVILDFERFKGTYMLTKNRNSLELIE